MGDHSVSTEMDGEIKVVGEKIKNIFLKNPHISFDDKKSNDDLLAFKHNEGMGKNKFPVEITLSEAPTGKTKIDILLKGGRGSFWTKIINAKAEEFLEALNSNETTQSNIMPADITPVPKTEPPTTIESTPSNNTVVPTPKTIEQLFLMFMIALGYTVPLGVLTPIFFGWASHSSVAAMYYFMGAMSAIITAWGAFKCIQIILLFAKLISKQK